MTIKAQTDSEQSVIECAAAVLETYSESDDSSYVVASKMLAAVADWSTSHAARGDGEPPMTNAYLAGVLLGTMKRPQLESVADRLREINNPLAPYARRVILRELEVRS